ncbi:MAG: class I SAM-dependent methyltransferase [Thalassobaculum sp.]|uniref:class I SAM-dependent methyltransferase n=1 Tax=Thalassobaculum sp. TaxID=2022740 RepID=UPI0032EE510D
MPNITEDTRFQDFIARASEPFRKICQAVVQELHYGDPAKAYALVDEVTRTKRMGPVDRRCMISLRIALRAVVNLRAAGLPPRVDIAHHLAMDGPSINGMAFERRHISDLQAALAAEVQARTATPAPCPNCGSAGRGVGWVNLVREGGVPHGRFYIDPAAAVAAAIPDATVDPEHAHLMVTQLLLDMDARAPVLACEGCGLRFMSWLRDDAVDERYLAPPFKGFDLNGVDTFGRAHVLTHTYWKAALPLYIEKLLGGVEGLAIYDFGCAEGVMASVLADLGAQATGSDLDRPKVSYGRNILGLSQLSDDGDYFWSLPDRSLDCLYASHSVEHVLRADELFDRFSRAVKPGGHLVVAVPCTAVREGGRVGEMGGDHLIGYDRTILAGFFRRHGFEVVDCQVDDGALPADRLDPLLHLPDWSGQPFDVTIVGRRHAA